MVSGPFFYKCKGKYFVQVEKNIVSVWPVKEKGIVHDMTVIIVIHELFMNYIFMSHLMNYS